MFLSPEELSRLTGYEANQRKRICKWLDNSGISYTINRLGDPIVLKSSVENKNNESQEPKLDWLKKSA